MAKKKQEIVPVEPEHSPLGASSCERWWNCPGSIKLIEQLPNFGDTTGFDAAKGTVAHTVASTLILNALDGTPLDGTQIHSKHVVDGHTIYVDDEMLDGVQLYVDFVLGKVKELKLDRWQILVEQGVRIPADETPYPLRGTVDCGWYVPYTLVECVDYKNGINPVPVEENKQLLFYALGLLYSIPEDERLEIPLGRINVVQPNLIGANGLYITTYEVDVQQLIQVWGSELRKRAARTAAANAERVAGAWCKYCPAKLQCPEYAADLEAQTDIDFKNFKMPVVLDWSNDQLAAFEAIYPRIQELAKEVHAKIYDKLQSGEKVGDFKLVKKRVNREWIDPLHAERTLGAELGDDIYVKPKFKSVKQIERLIDWNIKVAKANGEKYEAPDIKDLIMKPDKGYTIARESDSRETIKALIDSDFDDLDL